MKTKMFFASLFIIGVLVLTLGFAYSSKTQWGDAVPLGQGQARTFVTLDDNGKPEAIGISLSAAALSGLPADTTAMTIPFPDAAQSTVFDHLMLDWNPQGHEPPGVYDVPHFDFHFYLVPEAQVSAIAPGQCTTADNSMIPNPPGMVPVTCDEFATGMKPLAASIAPPDYQLVPALVPEMGNHLMDMTAPEFNGTPFTYTWIYGVWDGTITFFEPMITQAFLQSQPNISQPIKMPQDMPKAGWYPTEFDIHYLADSDSLVISLEAFKWFDAPAA